LIVYGVDRMAAVARLEWALEHFGVLGVATNIPLLRAIATEPNFRAGKTTTAYLSTHDFTAAGHAPQPPAQALAAAALWEAQYAGDDTEYTVRSTPFNPWTSHWGVASTAPRHFRYRVEEIEHLVTLTPAVAHDGYYVEIDGIDGDAGKPLRVVVSGKGRVTLIAGDVRATMYLARRGHKVLVSWRGIAYTLARPQPLTVE